MKFISEDIINPVIDQLSDSDDLYEAKMIEFSEAQPFLLSFLLSEGFNVLDDQEKSLLFYLAMIIYFSVIEVYPELDTVTLEDIEKTDEANWTIVDQNRFKTIKEIADHFFDGYLQEDLLAFVEDALMVDDEYEISNIGRNVIFVSMKSFIDVFENSHAEIPE